MRTLYILALAAALFVSACTGTAEVFSENGGNDAAISEDGGTPQGSDAGASLDANQPPPTGPVCGDGVAERGETCDGDCPTACDDGNACTNDVMSGAPETCDVACSAESIAACQDDDGCCPSMCDAGSDNDCSASCGDGVLDPGETCDPPGSCPIGCDDGDACTTNLMTGSANNCNVACSYTQVTSCIDDDGCCPSNCDSTLDNDCSPSCGNGVVEQGESCDGNCGTCNDGNSCTVDSSTGSAGTCDLVCTNAAINSCTDDDGCCPSRCNANNDNDCGAMCGNGTREAGEKCDGDCPTACDDMNSCTSDSLVGSAGSCNAECVFDPVTACTNNDGCCAPGCNAANDNDCTAMCGNGAVEPGETCDGNCPSCDDGMACTADSSTGSAATCDLTCTNTAITTCADGDGCCAPGCDDTNDDDCTPMCGNGSVETGETCDGNCPAGCDDGMACTADSSSGSAATCDLVCTNAPITSCSNGDGCCPSTCTPSNDSDCVVDCTDPASWPTAYDDFETEVVRLVNLERAAGANCGSGGNFAPAGPVTMQMHLQQAARCHSVDMAENDFFSHTGTGGSTFIQRCRAAGYTGTPSGENIGAGYSSPASVVNGWMNSDGHCANIMKANVTQMGIGYFRKTGTRWTNYWTMVTGR